MRHDNLTEAKRLYDLGLAIIWLKPKSKAPVESKWTTGPRKTWKELEKTFRPNYNIGTRLGQVSVVQGNYLSVIDCDMKSTNPKHLAEMENRLKALVSEPSPVVLSGRGNGSRHIYVLSESPVKPERYARSKELVKVFMPSVKASNRDRDKLGPVSLSKGWRMRPAWEISIMGDGQQVVLPPSIHPDSGKPYKWNAYKNFSEICLLDYEPQESDAERGTTLASPGSFVAIPVKLKETKVPKETRLMILTGKNVDDRSAALLTVSIEMVKAGLTRQQILSVLTDKTTYLGEAAFQHAKTSNRTRAAKWLERYTINKAFKEHSAEELFNCEVKVSRLDKEEETAQTKRVVHPKQWRDQLKRVSQKEGAPILGTFDNVGIILENAVGPQLFRRDLFANRDFYGIDAPWGGRKGETITDDDILKIRKWFAKKWRVEPSKDILFDAVALVAIENGFDPVLEMLENLPAWDGENRLETWLADYFEAEGEPEYLSQVFKLWIFAMVARVYEPGLKFDWMPIFEGLQGVGKSSFGRLLVGDKYFADWLPDLNDKDAALQLQGMRAVEMGELASLRRNEMETTKAFITRTVDKVRPPYGRKSIESPRRCVFFGTTNKETYLQDRSGNRRFKPVKVGRLDFDQLKCDRDQLFAEAVFLYQNDFVDKTRLDLEGEALAFEAKIHAQKTVSSEADTMFDILLPWLRKEVKKGVEKRLINFDKFRILELFDKGGETGFDGGGPLTPFRLENRQMQFAAEALRKIGAEKRMVMGLSFWRINEEIFKKASKGGPPNKTPTPNIF